MMDVAADFLVRQRDPGKSKAGIQEIEQRLAESQDPRLQAHLSWSLAVERHEYESLDKTVIELPNQSFDSGMDIYGANALVKIMSLGTGHTDCDTILMLPEDRIAFIGDLGFFKTHPYLGDSNPEKWVAVLDELATSKMNVFVPGHGPIGTKADLISLKSYIISLQSMVAGVVNSGGSEDDAASQPIPEFAADWAGCGRLSRQFANQLL